MCCTSSSGPPDARLQVQARVLLAAAVALQHDPLAVGRDGDGGVASSPAVNCRGNERGPSSFQTWSMPVMFQVKNIALPSGLSRPMPGERMSMSDWARRPSSGGTGRGRNFSSTSGAMLSAPWPE